MNAVNTTNSNDAGPKPSTADKIVLGIIVGAFVGSLFGGPYAGFVGLIGGSIVGLVWAGFTR